jgi:pantetheine-phosphate adenylyltransferase
MAAAPTGSTGPVQERIAVFPGSFDPLTNGHLDLINRAAHLFDRVIVGVLRNPGKEPLFNLTDRLAILNEIFAGRREIEVAAFEGLLVDFLKSRHASVVIRGIRSAADLDYERQMALTNHHMFPAADTILLLPAAEFGHISSSLVREIAALGGSVRGLVPPAVESWIAQRPNKARTASV